MAHDVFNSLLSKAPKGVSILEWQDWMTRELQYLWVEGLISNQEYRDLISETLLRY